MNQEKRSIWVKGIEQDILNNKRNKIIWLSILLLSSLILYFVINISDFSGMYSEVLGVLLIMVILVSLGGILSYHEHPNYLAYYFNQIGKELPDFENEHNYLKRNQKFIKNCAKQIKRLREQNTGHFADDIIDFFDNLYQIVLHLNYVFTEGDIDETYLNKQNNISSKLIELADIIHNNHTSLTPQHVELINEILNLIKNTPSKSFEYHKLFMENIKQKWADQSYVLRIFVVILSAFFVIFYGLLQLMMFYGLEKETSVPIAILGSSALIGILFSKIDLLIKR